MREMSAREVEFVAHRRARECRWLVMWNLPGDRRRYNRPIHDKEGTRRKILKGWRCHLYALIA